MLLNYNYDGARAAESLHKYVGNAFWGEHRERERERVTYQIGSRDGVAITRYCTSFVSRADRLSLLKANRNSHCPSGPLCLFLNRRKIFRYWVWTPRHEIVELDISHSIEDCFIFERQTP